MTRCNVLVAAAAAAAAARVLPGSAASCRAPRSRLGRGSPPAQASGVQASGAQPSWVQASRAQASGTQTSAPCAQRTMSALPPPPRPPLLLLLALLAAPAVLARRAESASASQPEAEHRPPPSPGNVTRLGSGVAGGGGSNSSGDAVVTRLSSLLRDLPTLKAAVIVACAFSALLIACLLLRVFRWVVSPCPWLSWLCGQCRHAAAPARRPHLRAQVLGLSALPPDALAVLLSLPGWDPGGGRAHLVLSGAHFRNGSPPFEAVRCVPSPRLHCFTLLTVDTSIVPLSSDHLPRFRGIYFYAHFTDEVTFKREVAYTVTQMWRDNLE